MKWLYLENGALYENLWSVIFDWKFVQTNKTDVKKIKYLVNTETFFLFFKNALFGGKIEKKYLENWEILFFRVLFIFSYNYSYNFAGDILELKKSPKNSITYHFCMNSCPNWTEACMGKSIPQNGFLMAKANTKHTKNTDFIW